MLYLQNYDNFQAKKLLKIDFQHEISPVQQIFSPIFDQKKVEVFVKRDDLLHPTIMGNKWRKLKYNLQEAKNQGFKSLLTFGGAYSNHIYAVASAGNEFGFETIGIIRGDELTSNANETLKYASKMGMKLIFVNRKDYLNKEFLALKYGENSYILPEGGTNLLALKGCTELAYEIEIQINPSHVCVALGTGGTFAGLTSANLKDTKIVGFPALKGFGIYAIKIPGFEFESLNNYEIINDYHFGGYGKYDSELMNFIQSFENEHNIPLEQVYNGKMFYGVMDLITKGFYPKNSKIVLVHTGGLQGKIKF